MYSNRRLKEFQVFIDGLSPIKFTYNGKCLYNDSDSSITKEEWSKGMSLYTSLLTANPIIYDIHIVIVQSHHAEVFLQGELFSWMN